MKLADFEKQNPVWLKLMDHYGKRLAQLRAQNDGQLSDMQTADIRGRIAEVKAFLALGDEPIKLEQKNEF